MTPDDLQQRTSDLNQLVLFADRLLEAQQGLIATALHKGLDLEAHREAYNALWAELERLKKAGGPATAQPIPIASQLDDPGFAKPGEWVQFLDKNGYDSELARARSVFAKGENLKVVHVEIEAWRSRYFFANRPEGWNTVMFERVSEPTTADTTANQKPTGESE